MLRDEGGILLALCATVVSLIGTYWFQGMVVEAVRDMQDGRRDFDLGELFRSVLPVLATLIAARVLPHRDRHRADPAHRARPVPADDLGRPGR